MYLHKIPAELGSMQNIYTVQQTNCTVPEGMLRMISVRGFQPNMYCYSYRCSCTPIVHYIKYIFVQF